MSLFRFTSSLIFIFTFFSFLNSSPIFGKSLEFCKPKFANNVSDVYKWKWSNCYGIIETKYGKWKGWRYEGEFYNGFVHGKGSTTYPNGDKYIGESKYGKKDGKGTYYYLASNKYKGDIYVGDYKNGKMDGKGTYYYLRNDRSKGDKFVGEYKRGKRNGKGTYYHLADGRFKNDIFIGEYKNGIKNGIGTYYHLANNQFKGTIFVGKYKNHKRNGIGITYYKNGESFKGEFKDGKRNGEGIYTSKNGKIREGVWDNNKFLYPKKISINIINAAKSINAEFLNKNFTTKNKQLTKRNLNNKLESDKFNRIKEVSKQKALEQRIVELEKKINETNKNKNIKQKLSHEVGSGFYVSKFRHIITNQHVVHQCNKITVGNSIEKQTPADLIASDKMNDLAILKATSIDMASSETNSFIQNLSIEIIPMLSGGLLRFDDVNGGEEILVAGYPLGNMISDTIKVTKGIVSATRGIDNNFSQFEIDAVIRKGNSGGPIYDKRGNIVGVAVSRLNLNRAEYVNFGIKGSTVKQFLSANDVPTTWGNRKQKIDTQDLYKIASKQTVMVVCHRD